MKILVACEYSGRVRDAFRALGHDAMSCDLLPTESEGPHYQGDVFDIINDGWDMLVAFPPCTYLCSMGVWWNHKRPERWPLTDKAFEFFMALYNAPIPHIAIENPIGIMSTRFRKPDCITQPWHHGETYNKATCLWLKNLPILQPTNIVDKGEFYTKANGARMAKWSHIQSGTNKEKRAKIASTTFQGIASAMATQWNVLTDPVSDVEQIKLFS